MPTRRDTPLMSAVRTGLEKALNFDQLTSEQLKKAGIYREKAAMYRRQLHLPSSVNLIALLLVLKRDLEIADPEDGRTWVLHFHAKETQLNLPLI
jgi:hypothetical protein